MKKFTQWFLIGIVIISISWMLNASIEKSNSRNSVKEKIITLPELTLFELDSTEMDTSILNRKSLALIFFNSACEHCQYEAKEIKNHIHAFANSTLVFISTESLPEIKAFALAYGLDAYQNISFTKINSEHAINAFGALSIPHVFIYGPDKKLRKEFKGEIKAETISKYLK